MANVQSSIPSFMASRPLGNRPVGQAGGSMPTSTTSKPMVSGGIYNPLGVKTANAQTTGSQILGQPQNPFMAAGNPNTTKGPSGIGLPDTGQPIDYSPPSYSGQQPITQKGLYGTVVGQLANQQGSPYNQATGGAINNLFQQSQNNPASGAQGLLQGIAEKGTPQVDQMTKNIKGLQQTQTEIANNPNLASEVASGRGQALTGQINAAQTGLSNALQQQGQQINAAGNAGQLGLTSQSQQIGAAQGAGSLAQTGQGQSQSALGAAAGYTAPHFNGYVAIDPLSGAAMNPGGASSAAFAGGGIGESERLGAKTQENAATLGALTGSVDGNGQSGMVGDFNSALQKAGTNAQSVNLANALSQGLNANTSGAFAGLQTNFQNILGQYAKVLGAQTVNSLMTSAQNQTIAQFFDSLTNQVKQIQSGNRAGTTNQAAQSTQQSTNQSNNIWSF